MPEIYPVNSYGPLMPGLVIGGVAIVHVFLAQFAVGGGLLMCYFQWLAMTGRNPHARRFVHGYFKALVLVSFVLGALTGVGIWFTTIQVSPQTIGSMVENFHWIWATEWTFFCLEIVAGYCFYRCHEQLTDRAAMTLLVLYAIAAWGSLFWINGILSWQLTPGGWVETHNVWQGMFNPSFWPSLLFRTVVALVLASLAACVVINLMPGMSRSARRSLINHAAYLMTPMVIMPLLGVWYLMSMPPDSRSWALGANVPMMLFLNVAIGASLAVGAYAIIGLVWQRLYINGATATLLLLLAFGATGGGEFVREGCRKPYSIRHVLYSNGIEPGQVTRLREVGSTTGDIYPLRDLEPLANDQLRLGARVFRRQCAICHTLRGTNALSDLTENWGPEQMRINIAKLQHTKPFMPPFAGTPRELEALVQLLQWTNHEQPPSWPETGSGETLEQIQRWLDEAGAASAVAQRERRTAS
ncbi:MAG: c-type cytochrome [Pirellulaceae bacterium]